MSHLKKETVTDKEHTKTVEYSDDNHHENHDQAQAVVPRHKHSAKANPAYERVMAGAIFVASPPIMGKLDFPSAPASIGPIGFPAAALAGFTLNTASVLLREASKGQKLSAVAPVGTLERAILAEAAFRVVERINLGAPYDKQVEDAMRAHIGSIGVKVAGAAPIVIESIMEPVVRIMLDQMKQRTAIGHNCETSTSFDRHYWQNAHDAIPAPGTLSKEFTDMFHEACQETSQSPEGKEEFFGMFAGPLISMAGNVLGSLLKGKKKGGAESSMVEDGGEESIFSSIPWRTLGKIGGRVLRTGVQILDARQAAKGRAGGAESAMGDEELFGFKIPILDDILGTESAMAESAPGDEELFGFKIPFLDDILGTESAMAESAMDGEELFGFHIPILSDILGESTMVGDGKGSSHSSGGANSLPNGSIGGDLVRRAIAGEAALQALLEVPPGVLQEQGIMDVLATIVAEISPGLPKYTIPVMKSLPLKIQAMVKPKEGSKGRPNHESANGSAAQQHKDLRKKKSQALLGGYSHSVSKFVPQAQENAEGGLERPQRDFICI